MFQDSPTNKLLYAKEIPEYKKRVQLYYQQIQEMSPLSEQEMNAHLAEESRVSKVFRTRVRHTELKFWYQKGSNKGLYFSYHRNTEMNSTPTWP